MARSYEQIGTILLVPIYKLLCRRRWRLEVSVQERNALRIQKLQELWYFVRAQEVFRSRLDALLPSALWVSPPCPETSGDADAVGQLLTG
ncbi:hypothetical protein NBRC3222_1514 [Acetobacter pasteurianus NBRC 3222]|nr:hypothetical protein NBRC3222_1514 [Acetobacter pasteurianus NBRC 3222]